MFGDMTEGSLQPDTHRWEDEGKERCVRQGAAPHAYDRRG